MKELIKKDIGIVFCIIFYSIFIVVTNVSRSYFDGAYWYIVNSIQRMLFGMIELFVFMKIYLKRKNAI